MSIEMPLIHALESKEWPSEVSNNSRRVANYNLGHIDDEFNSSTDLGIEDLLADLEVEVLIS